jgi:CHAD domain-containing protein
MGFKIKPHKAAAKEVRRAALERLGKAREALLLVPEQQTTGIHEARKRIKEVRALLRLVRTPIGQAFAQENRRFRDINRKLSVMRDAGALLETWDSLASENSALFARRSMRNVRTRLDSLGQGGAPSGGVTLEEAHRVLKEVLADVEMAEESVRAWRLPGKRFALVSSGLQRTFADGRRALGVAANAATDDHLHDWRKRVKDHWHHTRLLSMAWPAAFKVRAAMFKDLSQLLGQDHDLSMLQALLAQSPAIFGAAVQRRELGELVAGRRGCLQQRAFRLGSRLYAESPGALRKRWRRCWDLTCDEKRYPG